jgi:hypothetical protein
MTTPTFTITEPTGTPDEKRATRTTNRAVLVAALRSGVFPQAKGALCRVIAAIAAYCCLGLGCELARPTFAGEWRVVRGTSTSAFYDGYDEQVQYPSSGFMYEFYGIHYEFKLANLNDDGYSFNQIADYIEAQSHND